MKKNKRSVKISDKEDTQIFQPFYGSVSNGCNKKGLGLEFIKEKNKPHDHQAAALAGRKILLKLRQDKELPEHIQLASHLQIFPSIPWQKLIS